MISTIEIYKAIRDHLENLFPNILIQQKDIKNITRPSFYIQYIGKNFEKQAQIYFEDRFSFNIVYFSEKEELLELLEIEEAITRSFNKPFYIPDDKYIVKVEKNAIQSNLNEEDYFLNITIDFVLMQTIQDDESGDDIEYIDMTVENEEKAELTEYTDKTEDDGESSGTMSGTYNNEDEMSGVDI